MCLDRHMCVKYLISKPIGCLSLFSNWMWCLFRLDCSKSEVAVVADLDGTIFLVDTGSGKVLWSFASGRPIYYSYQAVLNGDDGKSNASGTNYEFYIDCDDDWALYWHSKSIGKMVCKPPFC